jgi:integration host factor subunit beta
MTKSELISVLGSKQPHLSENDINLAVNNIIQSLTNAVSTGGRVEIRGFGGFSSVPRQARMGRNPKTGESISVPPRHVVHFKPGMDMRERVNKSKLKYPVIMDL